MSFVPIRPNGSSKRIANKLQGHQLIILTLCTEKIVLGYIPHHLTNCQFACNLDKKWPSSLFKCVNDLFIIRLKDLIWLMLGLEWALGLHFVEVKLKPGHP